MTAEKVFHVEHFCELHLVPGGVKRAPTWWKILWIIRKLQKIFRSDVECSTWNNLRQF